MKCRKCGANILDDAAFCSQCGARTDSKRRATDLDTVENRAAGDDRAAGQAATVTRARARATSGSSKDAPEEELWTGTFSPKAMVGPAVGCALLSVAAVVAVIIAGGTSSALAAFGIAMVVIWGLLGLTLLYRRLTVRYRLTTYSLFHDSGLLSRTGNRIDIIDVDDVTVHQGIIARMLGIGTIEISSSDRTDPTLNLPGIEKVREIADLIDRTRRAERHRRGLHIEAI